MTKNSEQLRNIKHKIYKHKNTEYNAIFNINVLAEEFKCFKWVQSKPF